MWYCSKPNQTIGLPLRPHWTNSICLSELDEERAQSGHLSSIRTGSCASVCFPLSPRGSSSISVNQEVAVEWAEKARDSCETRKPRVSNVGAFALGSVSHYKIKKLCDPTGAAANELNTKSNAEHGLSMIRKCSTPIHTTSSLHFIKFTTTIPIPSSLHYFFTSLQKIKDTILHDIAEHDKQTPWQSLALEAIYWRP